MAFVGSHAHDEQRVVFFSNLVSNHNSRLCFDLTTMPSFDAHAFGMLIALAIATLALIIKNGVVSVVRVVEVVSVVPIAPSRAGRK